MSAGPAVVIAVTSGRAALAGPVAVLLVQLLLVRPRLSRRMKAVLNGQDRPRSPAHHVYVALDVTKVVALLVGGVFLLAIPT